MTQKPTPPNWWNDAVSWIDDYVQRTGEIEVVRMGDFSAVLRIPTANEVIYFKATFPPFNTEAVLTKLLAEWFPQHLPNLLAVDTERSWLLLPDLGMTLRQITEQDNDLTRWEQMLIQFAHLQQHAVHYVDDLLHVGITDRRLAVLPSLFTEALSRRSLLIIDQDHEDSITSGDYQGMMMFISQLADLRAELAAVGIPETLHHDDFHANNICLAANEYDFIFFDWAESCIAHPFYSLFMTLRYANYVFHADHDTLARLRDVYLASWTQYAPLPRLIEAYKIAAQLAKLCRALTWHQAASALTARNRLDASASATYWLNIFVKNID
ncbi:MAG: phosphotransferase [Anaerolineae bacterium]|nr:phosphotransferase [Anaerolineae bacterium]